MKKILVLIIMLFAFTCMVKANDERQVVSSIEATSNISEIFEYASTLEAPTFNITVGSEAHFETDEAGWHYKSGNSWYSMFDGYRFNAGKWQYRAKVVIDGDESLTHKLTNQTTVMVDGEAWTLSYSNYESVDGKSVANVYSPVYDLEATGELEFFERDTFIVYTNYIGVSINPLNVSSGVEGGSAPYIFSKTSGPSWINVSSSGVISGTPTAIGPNNDLVVRVTDAEDNYKEITIEVLNTVLPPAEREPIETIEATSNTASIPVLGNDIVKPTFTKVTTEGAIFADYNCGWYKKIGDNWVLQSEGKFTPGFWRYETDVVLQGEYAGMQRLSDDTVVLVDEIDWNFSFSGVGTEYYSGDITSPEYLIKDVITSIDLMGNIQEPRVGEDIVNPSIGAEYVNGESDLVNWIDVEAFWQYKTGDGFFDWKTATGKFEAGKTYHIRLMVTVNTDVYDLANIATFPVTFGSYELTQFQLNNKTVGEFIEFPEVQEGLVKPTINLKKNNNQVTISYDKQNSAVSYYIYRSYDNKKWKRIVINKETSYVDTGLTYNKRVYYMMRAYDGSKFSPYSDVASRKIVPNGTTLKVISGSTNNIKLGWDRVKTSGYRLYRSLDNKTWTMVKDINKNTTVEFNNTNLNTNRIYYYKIRAYQTVGSTKVFGPYSEVVKTRTAPEAPELSIKLNNYDAMDLTIGYVKGSSQYRVYRSLDNKTWERIEILPKEGRYTDGSHEIGTTYYYKVRACNGYDNCSAYAAVSLKQTTMTPSIKVSSATSKKVNVTIGSVEGNDGYRVYRSTDNKNWTMIKDIKGSVLSFDDPTSKGVTYYYKVRSYKVVDGSKVYSPFSGTKTIVSK